MSEALLDAPPATAVGPLADLILVRLLTPGKKPPTAATIRSQVGGLFRQPPSSEQVTGMLAALRTAGLLTEKCQTLTEAGRARALAYLSVIALPARCDWRAVKAKYLVPKALGLSPMSAADAKVVGNKDKLAALLLKRKLNLPTGTPTTLSATVEALACQRLGFSEQAKLKDVRQAVAADILQLKRPGMDGIRAIALDGLFAVPTPLAARPEPAEEFDLEGFAATVAAEARICPTGRFGDNKVFISHLWRRLENEPRFAALGLGGFKAKLIEANAARLLTLSRADLVHLMDANDVRESELEHMNALSHFVLIPRS